MKSILLSIKPEWVEKILNGKKIIEVRKKFPKGFKGWVYVYCTRRQPKHSVIYRLCKILHKTDFGYIGGKVVARFWCDSVEDLSYDYMSDKQDGIGINTELATATLSNDKLRKWTCLSQKQLDDYLNFNGGYAIHISKLQILDKPKELKEFNLTKAPQNYCYVEDTGL